MSTETEGSFTLATAQRLADCMARIQSRWDGVEYVAIVTEIKPKPKEKRSDLAESTSA